MKATWEERGKKKKSTTKQAFTESCLKVMEGKVHGFCCFLFFFFQTDGEGKVSWLRRS